jgi:hypothetical protein
MVLDPLSALGLASSVVQFVDFGCKLVTECKEIYHSVDGLSGEYINIELITTSLGRLSHDLRSAPRTTRFFRGQQQLSPPQRNEQPVAKSNLELWQDLASSCQETAEELLVILQKLKLRDSSHRRWKSFQLALKTILKKEEIKKLQERLDGFRSTMTTQLIVLLG